VGWHARGGAAFWYVRCGHVQRGGKVPGGLKLPLKLPEAFGTGMAVAKVAQPEPGEVCEHDEEAKESQEHEHGGEKEACEYPKRGFQAGEVRRDLTKDGWSGVEKRHSAFDGFDWLGHGTHIYRPRSSIL
jgi:hypothetical protein